jgi:hypothetical protein
VDFEMKEKSIFQDFALGILLGMFIFFFYIFGNKQFALPVGAVLLPISLFLLMRAAVKRIFGPKWRSKKREKMFGTIYGFVIALVFGATLWQAEGLLGGSPYKDWVLRLMTPAVFGWIFGRIVIELISTDIFHRNMGEISKSKKTTLDGWKTK